MAPGAAKATTAETPRNTASAARVRRAQVRREPEPSRTATRPPAIAPTTNDTSEVRVCATEKPGAPAAANPSTTTLPVMFAVKTCSRPR